MIFSKRPNENIRRKSASPDVTWLERVNWNEEAIAQLANLGRSREEVLLWKQHVAGTEWPNNE